MTPPTSGRQHDSDRHDVRNDVPEDDRAFVAPMVRAASTYWLFAVAIAAPRRRARIHGDDESDDDDDPEHAGVGADLA
jgi:hypothetical protein